MKFFSTGNLATRWGVCRETIIYWLRTGKLIPSTRVNGRYLFTENYILELEKTKKIASKLQNAA